MRLHQELALVFGSLSALSLVFSVAFPDNPHHLLNVIEHASIVCVMAVSFFAHQPVAGALQVVAIGVVAFIPMGISDSPFFGGAVAVIDLALIYAYSGFRTRPGWKLPLTVLVVFGLCVAALSNYMTPSVEMYARAVMWTLFVSLFCFILWRISVAMNTRFHSDFAADLIKQNRDLLELNKRLAGGCNDAHNP